MERHVLLACVVVLAAAMLSFQPSQAMSIPTNDRQQVEIPMAPEEELDMDEKATWLDTRDLQDEFKQLVLLAMRELEQEGKVSEGVVKSTVKDKRGRWQGFCFRRTRSGRFLPYICWKSSK